MRYWEPYSSWAIRVGCAHLQRENDALHDRLQQRHDHAAAAPSHKYWLPSARSTATLSSQALCEGEGAAAISRAAPIFSAGSRFYFLPGGLQAGNRRHSRREGGLHRLRFLAMLRD